MKVTYCSGGLVRVSHDGVDYQLPNSYDLIQKRINYFNKFGVNPQHANHAAVILTLQQFNPDFNLSADDLEVVNQVSMVVTAELCI